LALSVSAELGLAVALQGQTLAEFIASRDKVSGSVYVALLLVFAVMPRLRLRNHKAALHANSQASSLIARTAGATAPRSAAA
jgi:hypothetical protein